MNLGLIDSHITISFEKELGENEIQRLLKIGEACPVSKLLSQELTKSISNV